jgi:4-hydroxy-tetrahydrodipicolinate synthase
MNFKKMFSGTGVAIVTPFSAGILDIPALINLCEYLIKGGVEYIVALGSTGEASLLSESECREVLDTVLQTSAGRVPVVAGNFGGSHTVELVAKLTHWDLNGVSAILSSSPSYVKPTQSGISEHYRRLADASSVPVIMYNVPGRTCSNMQWQTTVELANTHENIIGIKEASGNIPQFTHILRNAPEGFLVLSGDDESAMATTALGGHGVISVIANAYPKEFSEMIRATLNSNLKKAQKINEGLFTLHDHIYKEGNPAGIKTCLEIKGICLRDVRLPLTKGSDTLKMGLKEEMQKVESLLK